MQLVLELIKIILNGIKNNTQKIYQILTCIKKLNSLGESIYLIDLMGIMETQTLLQGKQSRFKSQK